MHWDLGKYKNMNFDVFLHKFEELFIENLSVKCMLERQIGRDILPV